MLTSFLRLSRCSLSPSFGMHWIASNDADCCSASPPLSCLVCWAVMPTSLPGEHFTDVGLLALPLIGLRNGPRFATLRRHRHSHSSWWTANPHSTARCWERVHSQRRGWG